MLWLYFQRIPVIFYWSFYMLAFISSANAANNSSSFIFPYITADPFPVLVKGPAGELFNFTKTGYSTGNSFTLAYATVPPERGPPPHIHHLTNEWFYFPEGGFEFFQSELKYPDPTKIPNGDQLPKANMSRYRTQPGDLVYGPAFYVHAFRNVDNVTRPLIFVWTPDTISQYFFQVGQIITDPCKIPPPRENELSLYISEAPKYGINQSANWSDYVNIWIGDWQPPRGMNAHGQELLDLLTNSTAQYISCQKLTSHAPSICFSFALMYYIIFIIAEMFYGLF